MDELSDIFADNTSITNSFDSSKKLCDRSHQYKQRFSENQKLRRNKLLQLQKKLRKEVVDNLRKINDDDWTVFTSNLSVDTMDDSPSDTTTTKDRFKDQLMLSEWLVEIPEDLTTNWLMVPCIEGRRCLVVAKDGKTCAYNKAGYLLNKFHSLLPGGSRQTSLAAGQGSTFLDCVYHHVSRTYYVLDVICWNNHPVLDSQTDFRFYWLQSKISESPSVSIHSKENPNAFKILPYFNCTSECMQEALQRLYEVKVDGFLFYHKQAHYLCGSTPLVLWLKPYMLPELFGVEVQVEYLKDRPADYKGFREHVDIVQSDENMLRMHQDIYSKQQKNKQRSMDVPDVEVPSSSDIQMTVE